MSNSIKQKWTKFLYYFQDVFIDFLKTAVIYFLFYLSTILLSTFIIKAQPTYSHIIESVHFWGFIIMFTLTATITVIRLVFDLCIEFLKGYKRLRNEFDGWVTYLPIDEDIQVQTNLLNDCSVFRIVGLRFNKALNREKFCQALCNVKEAKLLLMARITSPKTELEYDHNRRYDESIDRFKQIIPSAKGKIIIKESSIFPTYNILVFDDIMARIKTYDRNTWSAKKSPITLYHQLIHRKELFKVINDFDESFAKAKNVNL